MTNVHIIIPSFNGLKYLKVLLPLLREYTQHIQPLLTIIDNASSDQSQDWLRQQDCRYIECSINNGFAKANNLAVWGIDSEFLLFLNQDTRPTQGFLDNMLRLMNDPKVAIVGAKLIHMQTDQIHHAGIIFVRHGPDRGFPCERLRGKDARIAEANPDVELYAVTAACMLVRTKVFHEIGGLDEAYVNGWEDNEFCCKVKEAGHKIMYSGQTVIYHDAESSPGRLDHDWQNKELFRERWIKTGRIFKLLGWEPNDE